MNLRYSNQTRKEVYLLYEKDYLNIQYKILGGYNNEKYKEKH